MRLQKKSLSKVSLTDILRRRKTTLEKYLIETGIVTYDLLVSRCESSGFVPPTLEAFYKAQGRSSPAPVASSPTEGVIVMEPPAVVRLVNESDGSVESELSLSLEPEDSSMLDEVQKPFKKKKLKA